MKGDPRHGRHRQAVAPPRGHSDSLAYYRARAAQPKPAAAFDAEWRARSPAERAAPVKDPREGSGVDPLHDQIVAVTRSAFIPRFTPYYPSGNLFFWGVDPGWDRPKIENAGVQVGEIVGHRMWRVSADRGLYSGANEILWRPGEVMSGDPEIEGRGVHAFKSRTSEHFQAALLEYHPDSIVQIYMRAAFLSPGKMMSLLMGLPYVEEAEPLRFIALALGTVRLYGTVIEHEEGWRAQHSMIESIDSVLQAAASLNNIESADLLKQLRERYGI